MTAVKKRVSLLREAERFFYFVAEFSAIGLMWVLAGTFVSWTQVLFDATLFFMVGVSIYAALRFLRKLRTALL